MVLGRGCPVLFVYFRDGELTIRGWVLKEGVDCLRRRLRFAKLGAARERRPRLKRRSPMTHTRMHLLRREASLQSAHSSVPQFMRAARASTPLDHRAGLTKKKWGGSMII